MVQFQVQQMLSMSRLERTYYHYSFFWNAIPFSKNGMGMETVPYILETIVAAFDEKSREVEMEKWKNGTVEYGPITN